jgi:hypothetical protein
MIKKKKKKTKSIYFHAFPHSVIPMLALFTARLNGYGGSNVELSSASPAVTQEVVQERVVGLANDRRMFETDGK